MREPRPAGPLLWGLVLLAFAGLLGWMASGRAVDWFLLVQALPFALVALGVLGLVTSRR